jgi:hypothetical protein
VLWISERRTEWGVEKKKTALKKMMMIMKNKKKWEIK